jgi:hypothetical protein
LLGTSNANCGKGGEACAQCNVGGGEACTAQACVAGAPATGSPCTADADCAGISATSVCKLQTQQGTAQYAGGYCTQPCGAQTDPECATGSVCVNVTPFGEQPVCMKECANDSECRAPGYRCYDLGDVGICWIDPLPEPDAGPPSPPGKMGSACTMDSECNNPPDNGFCIPETAPLSDGGTVPLGMPGGSCTAQCGINPDHCGDGGLCLTMPAPSAQDPVNETIDLCVQECNGPLAGQADCRAGYVCSPLFLQDGGIAPRGYCTPACTVEGNANWNPWTACESFQNIECRDAGTHVGYCCPPDGGTDCF